MSTRTRGLFRRAMAMSVPFLLAAGPAWSQDGGDGGAGAVGLGGMLIGLLIAVVMIAAMWKVFDKAGKPGWAAIIPIYNTIVLLEIAQKPIWWIILMFIPLVNLIIVFIIMNDVATRFGQGIGFTLGLVFLPIIFWPLLAFGDAQYRPQMV